MKKLVLLLAVVASATMFSCSGSKATTDTTATEEAVAPVQEQVVDTPAVAADSTGANA